MHEIDWESPFYPLYGSPIILPKDTILWRGHSLKYPTLQNRPTFFGSKETASGYNRNNSTELSSFITVRDLRIVDIRYLKVLLKDLFQEIKTKHHIQSDINMIKIVTISLGLCSLHHQLQLIHNVYGNVNNLLDGFKALYKFYNNDTFNNFIERDGVRIGETTTDGYTMAFIKGLFENIFDGIISPRLYSPFHIEKKGTTISPELILFTPHKDVIEIPYNSIPSNVLYIPINGIILKNNYIYTTKKINKDGTSFYMRGGGNNTIHPIDDFNELLDTNNKDAIRYFNKGYTNGLKMKNKYIISAEPPKPTCSIDFSRIPDDIPLRPLNI
jgi:hypothetical protein